MRSFFAGPGLQALLKALIQVKAHTRKDGTQVRAHTRNVQSKAERHELVTALSQKMAAGEHVRHATLASALGGARHASRANGKAAHVYEHPEGGWVATHDEGHTAGHKERIVAVKGKARLHQAKGPSRSLAHLHGPIAEHAEKPVPAPKVKPARAKAQKKAAEPAPVHEGAALLAQAQALNIYVPPFDRKLLENYDPLNADPLTVLRTSFWRKEIARQQQEAAKPAAVTPKPVPTKAVAVVPKQPAAPQVMGPEREALLKQRDRILPEPLRIGSGRTRRASAIAYIRHSDNTILLEFDRHPGQAVMGALEKYGFKHHAVTDGHMFVAPYSERAHRFANYTQRRLAAPQLFGPSSAADASQDRADEKWLSLTPEQRRGWALAPLKRIKEHEQGTFLHTEAVIRNAKQFGVDVPPGVASKMTSASDGRDSESAYWERKVAAAKAARHPDMYQYADVTPRGLLMRAKEAQVEVDPAMREAALGHDHAAVLALDAMVTRAEAQLGAPFTKREKDPANAWWTRKPMALLKETQDAGITMPPADVENLILGHPDTVSKIRKLLAVHAGQQGQGVTAMIKLWRTTPDGRTLQVDVEHTFEPGQRVMWASRAHGWKAFVGTLLSVSPKGAEVMTDKGGQQFISIHELTKLTYKYKPQTPEKGLPMAKALTTVQPGPGSSLLFACWR